MHLLAGREKYCKYNFQKCFSVNDFAVVAELIKKNTLTHKLIIKQNKREYKRSIREQICLHFSLLTHATAKIA